MKGTLELLRDLYDASTPRVPGGQQVGPQRYVMNIASRQELRAIILICEEEINHLDKARRSVGKIGQ